MAGVWVLLAAGLVFSAWVLADLFVVGVKALRQLLSNRSYLGLGALPLADVSSTPDHQAFTAGVEVGVVVIALGIGATAVFGLFRWALSRMSDGE